MGETFGATGERPTGAVTVGDRLGATDGGLAGVAGPLVDGAGADVPDEPPEDDPPDEDPPDEDPPDDPVCARAMAGINNEAAKITTRTGYSPTWSGTKLLPHIASRFFIASIAAPAGPASRRVALHI